MTVSGDRLAINVNGVLKATLPHWPYDTFYGPFKQAWNGNVTAQFYQNASGQMGTLGLAFHRAP